MSDVFEDSSYWAKLKAYALVAGREVIEKSLWLYYAAQAPDTPAWAKTVIYSALAYFVLPADAIPDVVPLAGFSDDLGALAAAVASVAMYIDDDVRAKAAAKLSNWFSTDADDDGSQADVEEPDKEEQV